MANWLLTGDWHVTDNPIDDYRWEDLRHLEGLCKKYNIDYALVLGDISDRKDRHSATLLNRLTYLLYNLTRTVSRVIVTMGNHDQPINGTPYWTVLNRIPNVDYVTSPQEWANTLLLPFSANPLEDWKSLPLSKYKALFMHQTIAGVVVERGHVIEEAPNPMPILPRGVPAFSGDIHRPQKIGGIQYVGTPYPVRFGEDWPGQVMVIKDDDFKNPITEVLPSIRRAILDIKALSELPIDNTFKSRDQVRIRFHLTTISMDNWGATERECHAWADRVGCSLLSCEATLEETPQRIDAEGVVESSVLELLPPAEVLNMFGKSNNLSQLTVDAGLELLKQAM